MSEQPWETWMMKTPLRWLLIAPLQRFHPWGFEGMSAWNVFRFFVVGVAEGALGIRARPSPSGLRGDFPGDPCAAEPVAARAH